MIYGVGTDIVAVARIAGAMENPHFIHRVYTQKEQIFIREKGAEFAAGRWAGKEAVAKAMGAGLAQCPPDCVEILPDEDGRPTVTLSGTALERMKALHISRIHISLSHDGGNAIAFAVAEGEEA